jgi:predicted TIM-barrel fold metal-dependent hydrolase
LGLTFDAWVLEPQLDDVIDLARAFPDQPIVLDHCGTPLNIAGYRGHLHERFDPWREKIRTLAQCPNVTVKLGGLAMAFCGMPNRARAGMSSEALAALWRPYLETCIEAFGPDRAMFESNFPVDKWGADYRTCGTRSNAWRPAFGAREAARCSPERRRGSTALVP